MNDTDRSAGGSGTPESRPRLTPLSVQQKEFRVSFRGYNEREVDEFLDLVTEELQRYEGEIMRLRTERATFDPASFSLDAETQRLLREARERADAIIREAEARVAGIPTGSGADTRAVVAPYLNRERDFLQTLGSLVQEHARTIKTMVEEARRRTERPALPDHPASPEEPDVSPNEADASPNEADASRDEPDASQEEEEVVVLSERLPTSAEPAEQAQPEGARSLRELFWGEE